jgi:hypothetical protein
MDKLELSAYLVNLHTLIDAQSKGAHSIPSTVLADEYNKHWGLLKEAIATEKADDETRTSRPQQHGRDEA